MTDMTTSVRPILRTAAEPSPVSALVPAPGGTTLITEQQVRFATVAAVALPRVTHSRWTSITKALGALFTESHTPKPPFQARRHTYLENGLMAREMSRL